MKIFIYCHQHNITLNNLCKIVLNATMFISVCVITCKMACLLYDRRQWTSSASASYGMSRTSSTASLTSNISLSFFTISGIIDKHENEFNGPSKILIAKNAYEISRCQKFIHVAASCNIKPICVACREDHLSIDYPKKSN